MAHDSIPRDLNSVPKFGYDHLEGVNRVASLVWNPVTLAWEKMTQPIIDATNSNLYLSVDQVEALLGTFVPTSVTIVTSGTVKTITETNGIKTRTTTIDGTNPLNKTISVVGP